MEVDFAARVARAGLDLRAPLMEAYRALRDEQTCEGELLRAAMCGAGAHPRSPALCARLLRVLCELGLATYEEGVCRVLEAPRTELDRSVTYRDCAARLSAALTHLDRLAAEVGSRAA